MYMHTELVEALSGFQKPVSTLDKCTLVITSYPGQITKCGDVKCVPKEGTTSYCRPYGKGCLVTEFKVNFPENGFPLQINCHGWKSSLRGKK